MHRIMLVDDELNILSALRRALVEESYETDLFTDVHEALNRAECVPYDRSTDRKCSSNVWRRKTRASQK